MRKKTSAMDTNRFTVNQLIDIAFNACDVGTVNLKILRTVLKILVREVNIQDLYTRVLVKDLQPQSVLIETENVRPKMEEGDFGLPFCSQQQYDKCHLIGPEQVCCCIDTMDVLQRVGEVEARIDKLSHFLDNKTQSLERQKKEFERKKKDDVKIIEAIEESFESVMDSMNEIGSRIEQCLPKAEYLKNEKEQHNKVKEFATKLEKLSEVAERLERQFQEKNHLQDIFDTINSLEDRITCLEENTNVRIVEEVAFIGQCDLSTVGKMCDDFIGKVPMNEDVDADNMETNICEQLRDIKVNMEELSVEKVKLRNQLEMLQLDLKQNETDKKEFYKMQSKVSEIERRCEQLRLVEELNNSILMLRTTEANKAEVDAALKNKAEVNDVMCKVDKNEYEMMVKDITNDIHQMRSSLSALEETFGKTVKVLSTELESKADKMLIERLTEDSKCGPKATKAKSTNAKISLSKSKLCEKTGRRMPDFLYRAMKRIPLTLRKSHSRTNIQSSKASPIVEEDYIHSPKLLKLGSKTALDSETTSDPQDHATPFGEINKNIPLEGIEEMIQQLTLEAFPPQQNI